MAPVAHDRCAARLDRCAARLALALETSTPSRQIAVGGTAGATARAVTRREAALAGGVYGRQTARGASRSRGSSQVALCHGTCSWSTRTVNEAVGSSRQEAQSHCGQVPVERQGADQTLPMAPVAAAIRCATGTVALRAHRRSVVVRASITLWLTSWLGARRLLSRRRGVGLDARRPRVAGAKRSMGFAGCK